MIYLAKLPIFIQCSCLIAPSVWLHSSTLLYRYQILFIDIHQSGVSMNIHYPIISWTTWQYLYVPVSRSLENISLNQQHVSCLCTLVKTYLILIIIQLWRTWLLLPNARRKNTDWLLRGNIQCDYFHILTLWSITASVHLFGWCGYDADVTPRRSYFTDE